MITTVIILLTFALVTGYLFTNRDNIRKVITNSTTDRFGKVEKEEAVEWHFKHAAIALFILIGGFAFAYVQPFTVERVDAGSVGIKAKLAGDNRGVSKYEYKTGLVLLNNWVERLYEYATSQQYVDYGEQTVTTKGGFPVKIHPKFNYNLNPGTVGDMFTNLRLPLKEIEQTWLKNAVLGGMNDVSNLWTIDEIFNNREKFELQVAAEAGKRVSRWFSIPPSQLRTNITPPEALVAAINVKTQAIQDVQVAENQRRVAIAEAERKIAEAKGDSAQAVIAAAGEAEAMKRKASSAQVSLSPLYVEYLKVQKWNGALPTIQDSGSGMILNVK